jgi:LysM repeat protein
MNNKRQGVAVLFSILMIASVLVSACERSLSAAPAETATAIPTGLFVTPLASVENPMAMIEEFGRQTQAAQTAAAGGTPGADAAATATNTPDPAALPTATPTIAVVNSTPTNASGAAATAVPATSVPVGSRPPTYTLQKGEFPYCIARRYDVDPDALLRASGLTAAEANSLVTGTVLTIPQTGSFPGPRALQSHPTTYTVASADETVYSVACKFGDVEPNSIASANNISVSAKLTVGQQLQIP